jgi:glycosyltransferase involved in cell wall biosynthesis
MTERRKRVALVYRPGRHQTGPSTYETTLIKHLSGYVYFDEYPTVASCISTIEKYDCVHLLDIKQLNFSGFLKLQASQATRFLIDVHDHYWVNPGPSSYAIDGPLRTILAISRMGVNWAILGSENVGVIVHSRAVENALRGFAEGRIGLDCNVVPYGVDEILVDSASPIPDDYILFVGRDYFRKGLAVLIKAFELLATRHPHLKLVVIGGEYLHSSIYFRMKTRRFKWRVHFLGGLSNEVTRSYIAHAKVLVLPSFIEASSIAVMEAMSLGVPAIVSDAGGLPELFEGDPLLEQSIVPVGDSGLLADKIEYLCSDENFRAALSSAMRKRWEQRYTAVQMARRVAEIYTKI